MSAPFNPQRGQILVDARLEGPAGAVGLQLVLDTGATRTLIKAALLVTAGYDLAAAPMHRQVTTASGVAVLPLLPVSRLTALGQDRTGFDVFAHTLPPTAAFDGLLGLDFFRGQVLTLDFRNGQITLT
jgi:predicted aspartyl protease